MFIDTAKNNAEINILVRLKIWFIKKSPTEELSFRGIAQNDV